MASSVTYGEQVPDDSELRLCGDVAGRRVIVLGIGQPTNALSFAERGAKTIVLDASAEAIAELRQSAEVAEVHVECHQSDLADLGFVTSASVDVVLAAHTLDEVDDLSRLLRQVHRVLRPDAPFVVALTHPVAAMFTGDPSPGSTPATAYGASARPFAEWFMALGRADFRVDVVHELTPRNQPTALAPSVLILRSRKLGV